MSQTADLYGVLRSYAVRSRSPSFTVDGFATFLEKYSKRYASERPEYAYWSENTERRVSDAVRVLVDEGKCALTTDERGLVITVPQFYVDLLQHYYKSFEESPELPFPDEDTLKTVIPRELLRSLSVEIDLQGYLVSPQTTPLPILKLVLPEGGGTVLAVASMIPKRLLELALLKARHYLRSHNNKEYVLHKLAPAFQGKETMLKEAVNLLLVRPFDSMNALEKAGDFSFPFWAYLASLVKGDVRKKNDKLPEDIAVFQAMLIIEFFNNHYKGRAQKELQVETALHNLEITLDKVPWYFSMDDIIRFKDTKGLPLLGQYSQKDLEEFIKEKTSSESRQVLPELLIVHGASGERWFVSKARLLPLAIKLLGDYRPRIKNTITQRWYKLQSDFRSDSAMEDDEAFEGELRELTATLAPVLSAVLSEKILYLVHEEMDGSENGVPQAGRLFYKDQLVPMSQLYMLSRKDLLTDVRMLLPFWHTVPIISAIVAFFHRLSKPKPKKQKRPAPAETAKLFDRDPTIERQAVSATAARKADPKAQLKEAARDIQHRLIPDGYTTDAYMRELEEKWNRNLNSQAKRNLTEDVNSLIRDYLRKTARTLRAATFTAERLSALAATLSDTEALMPLPNREALRLYIQLYMIKLVLKS